MGAIEFIAADWRNAADYAHLEGADRSAFAWEWLRRLPDYRAAAASGAASPIPFGLCRFEDAALGATGAHPIWHADADRSVLRAVSQPGSGNDLFDIQILRRWTTLHVDRDGEHWRIGDRLRSIRVDIVCGTLREGPAHLAYSIGGIAAALPVVLTLRRLLALARTGQWPAHLFPPETRAGRWIMMLRVSDALAAGASHREIAVALFGATNVGARWRSSAPSYRLRIQRLAAGAHSMAAGDWRRLLDPATPGRQPD